MNPLLLFSLALLATTGPAHAGHLLALDKDGGRLHVIDRDSFTLRHSVEVGKGPHEVIASADGQHAWVALYGDAQHVGHHLVEVRLASGEVLRRIDTTPLLRPHGLARAGDNLYFTAEMNRALGRLNPAEGRVDRILGLGQDGSHMVEIAPDGQQLLTTDMGSGTVTRLDFRGGTPLPKLTHYAVGAQPEGLAIHPGGTHAWVGLNGEGKIKILDLDRGTLDATLEAGSYPARIEFSRDGKLAFAIDPQASRLLVFDVDGRKLRYSHAIAGVPLGILPADDPTKVYLTLVQAGEVVEVDVASGKVLQRVDVGKVADGIAGTPAQG